MKATEKQKLSELVKDSARDLGFDLVGIAPAGILAENAEVLKEWCASGMNAGMDYLEKDIEKRSNPEKLFPGTKSVIVTGLNYFSERQQVGQGIPVLSRYSYGRDYHYVIKRKLETLLTYIRFLYPSVNGRSYVDSAPVIEKGWAVKAGLGWQGRNSLIINQTLGSFFFIGIILTDTELEYDEPSNHNYCGDCRMCIEECPTGAINANRTIDARKCIAYHTIESKAPVSEELAVRFKGRVFGCDICQEVCPWNRNARPHNNPEFEMPDEIRSMTVSDWLGLKKDDFDRLFKQSAIGRRKYEIFKQIVTNVTKFSG